MSNVEWWKQFDGPKYKPSDELYFVDRGEVIEAIVTEVIARYTSIGAKYRYELEDEAERDFSMGEDALYTDSEVPERICRIAALKEDIEGEEKWITHAKGNISYLKELTPEGIKKQIDGCEEDIARWMKNIEIWKNELKELEEANGK